MKRILSLAFVIITATTQPLFAQTEPPAIDNEVAEIREFFIAGDYATGFPLMLPLADAGHPRAQNLIAASYQYGNGVQLDAAQALRYFELARAQGYPPAMHNLGVLYEIGMPGVEIDLTRARNYYAEGAALGYGPAISGYGAHLMNGTGGPADVVNAIRLFQTAAGLGDELAHEWLGYAYASAVGVPEDLERARHHYIVAATLGLSSAQNRAGYMLEFGEGGPVDLERAMEFYHAAIEQDFADAGINAAWMIFDNPDVYPARIDGLALCYWAVDNATEDRVVEYGSGCEEMAASFSASEQRQARKAADAL